MSEHGEIIIPVSGPEKPRMPQSGMKETEPSRPATGESTQEEAQNDAVSEVVERLQRLQAEFSNYKKRIDNERKSLFSIAKGDLIMKLLAVLDDFERMVNHQGDDCRLSMDGVRLIYQNLRKILVDEGLEEIPAKGEKFDPEIHEAVSVETTEAERDGVVLEEWQKGYRFGGRMLRPSRVKVGRHE